MWADSHCHLQYEGITEDALSAAVAAGVGSIICVGTDAPQSEKAIEVARAHPGTVWATVGLHPHDAVQGVDGIVVIAPVEEAVQVASAVAVDVPMVIVAPRVEAGSRALAVAVDQRQGARLVVRHLAELGHTRIAHVGGPLGWLDAIEREGGWREELDALGREDLMIVVGGVIPTQDFEALRAAGADAIYPPGTVISRAAIDLVADLRERLG